MNIAPGYVCSGDFNEIGALYVEGLRYPLDPYTFSLPTGTESFRIDGNAITLGKLTPQVATFVSLPVFYI